MQFERNQFIFAEPDANMDFFQRVNFAVFVQFDKAKQFFVATAVGNGLDFLTIQRAGVFPDLKLRFCCCFLVFGDFTQVTQV